MNMEKDKDHSLKVITILVIAFHGLFLSVASFNSPELPQVNKQNQKLVVQTITLKAAPVIPVRVEEVEEIVESAEKVSEQVAAASPIDAVPPMKQVEMQKVEMKPVEPIKKIEMKPVEMKPVEPIKKVEMKPVTPIKKVEMKPVQMKGVEPIKPIQLKPVEPIKPVQPIKSVDLKTPQIAKVDVKAEAKKKVEADAKLKAAQAKKKELLTKAQENLAKIDKVSVSKVKVGQTSKVELIGNLSVDSQGNLSVRETLYRDELSARLKSMLKLPEHGEVKIKLTINKTGKFLKLDILTFDSEKNKKYIENTIKTLTFPSFQEAFKNLDEYTFSITLK